MPRPLLLTRSGPHRVACSALYRALLRRSELLRPNKNASLLKEHVKRTFRVHARLKSPSNIRAALKAGYAILDNTGAGKFQFPESISRILFENPKKSITGLATLEDSRKNPPSSDLLRKRSPDAHRRWPHPDARPILDRPVPIAPERRRRIPVLIQANHFPILRYGKPQSPFLSYYIRTRTREREKRVTKMQALQETLIVAEDEDEWDRMLMKDIGLADDNSENSWTSCIKTTLAQINQVHLRNKNRRMEFAQKMHEIVEKEKALVEQERAERKHLRHQAYRDRKMEREHLLSIQPMNK